jgi:hypothetical protein
VRGLLLDGWDSVVAVLPASGRHLLAQFDADTVTVFQSFDREVGDYAIEKGCFGGPAFRRDRSSAIRLSLLDVLSRSDWGEKPGREVTLALRLRREAFDVLLRQAIHSAYPEGVYPSKRSWQLATRYSSVSITWSPDRDLAGCELSRYCARFGIRDRSLVMFASEWIDDVIDLSGWVEAHRGDPSARVPRLASYPVGDDALLARLTYEGP